MFGWILLTLVAGAGSAVATFGLIRGLIMRKDAIAETECPEYMRHTCNVSQSVFAVTALTWGAAAVVAHAEITIAALLMAIPFILVLVLTNYSIEWLKTHPESEAYVVAHLGDRAQRIPWIRGKRS